MTPREAASTVASASTAATAWGEPGGGCQVAASARPEAQADGQVVGLRSDLFEIARVLACDGRHALIDLHGRQEWARIAIPPPSAVSAGDFVVVAGRGSEWWAIGTLGDPWEAADDSAPAFDSEADIVIHAPHGRIALVAARIWLGGERVSIFAKALRATATSCLLQCQTVNQWVAGLVSLTVGRLFQGVTGDYHHHSQSIVERAEGQVTIKGDRINLN
jgi:hypothetical protein